MPPSPLLSLRQLTLQIGANILIDDLNLHIYPDDRLCIVGRNGCGKSTLMKVVHGILPVSEEHRFVQPGVTLSYLPQDLPWAYDETILSFLSRSINTSYEDKEGYVPLEPMMQALNLEPHWKLNALSGGQSRRVALAQALLARSDILLLDEPTNHLDLEAILWLESTIASWRGAVLMISHDQAFLRAVAKSTLWIEGKKLRCMNGPFSQFDTWCETVLAEEAKVAERLDTKLAAELHWLHRGVTARRRRNQGRLRQLQGLRAQKEAIMRAQRGSYTLPKNTQSELISARLVDIEDMNYRMPQDGRMLFRQLNVRLMRQDRLGLVGPNGAGKSTLLNLIEGTLLPTSGRIERASAMKVSRFYQDYRFVNQDLTPWEILCETGGDSVTVGGKSQHVVAYLKNFLFSHDQVKTPIKTLSGGERHRLLLAKLFTAPADLLLLDEPTNDLDSDTLELLQELIHHFKGALVIVSHDRDFLDKTTTSILALDGQGQAQEFIGGFSEYWLARQKALQAQKKVRSSSSAASTSTPPTASQRDPKRTSYKEQYLRATLPGQIAQWEQDIQQMQEKLSDPTLYSRDQDMFQSLTTELASLQHQKEEAENLWLELELKAP